MQAGYVIFFALFVLMALTIAIKLPRYLRMTKIAEQLRSQAGFLEEQHALLQVIQDSVSDGILLIGENGQVKAFNAAAAKSLQEMKESAIRALVEDPSDRDIVQWEDRLIERLKTVVPGYGQLYVFRDITEQKRQTERVGHELNNLLTGIMGNAGLALDRLPPGDPLATLLDDVIRASERAAAVSRQLLANSGDAGRLAARPLDVSTLVEEMARLAQASISKRVQLRMELQRDLPLAEGDVTKVRQVALNLIAKGAEAIGDADGVVTVRTGVEEIDSTGAPDLAPGRYVYLEVQDDGCGMDEERQAAVLGILRAHHGAIRVNSAPGKGSKFRVLVPAQAVKQRAASAH
jgi:signal transduction histidine kinase